jgi:hypothetical protein
MTRNPTRGRRMALPPPERVARGLRARLNLTAVLAVVLPAATIGALALVSAPEPDEAVHAPRETGLNLAILTCPSSISGSQEVAAASATGGAGPVEVTEVGSDTTSRVDVPADRPATDDAGDRPLVVRAVDRMAAGLVAARLDDGPAAASCTAPTSDQWFTGLGAAARHSSVLELVNPTPAPRSRTSPSSARAARSTRRPCEASPSPAAAGCGWTCRRRSRSAASSPRTSRSRGAGSGSTPSTPSTSSVAARPASTGRHPSCPDSS